MNRYTTTGETVVKTKIVQAKTMPFAELKEGRIYYELAGPTSAPVLMFSNSLGTNLAMWDAQCAKVSKKYRVLRYDKRGHGKSWVPPATYTVEQLGRDVVALLDFLSISTVDFCGLSIGGQTGMWLGANVPQRLTKLLLCNTAAQIGNATTWNTRIETVRKGGVKAISDAVVERWFTADFRAKCSGEVSRIQHMLDNTDAEGYAGCCAAVRDFDYRGNLQGIRMPTLVISGTYDLACPPADGRFLAEKIPHARYVELHAAHLSNVEDQDRFTTEISQFLAA